MKKRNTYSSGKNLAYFSLAGVCLFALSLVVSLSAQEEGAGKGAASGAKEEKDVPGRHVEFAAPFQTNAKKAVREFNERVQGDLRRLNVLVKNYGSEVPGAQEDFNSIQGKQKGSDTLL